MIGKFYLADEKHINIKNEVVEIKGLLYFEMPKAGYNGKATKDHIKQYRGLFQEFKVANPDYVLPVSLTDLEFGSPTATAAVVPAVEVPVVEAVEEPAEVVEEAPAPKTGKRGFKHE